MKKPRWPNRASLRGGITERDLERIEADPRFQRMMEDSEEDMRAGRYITDEEMVSRVQARRKRRAG
jgi:hypothetical protein